MTKILMIVFSLCVFGQVAGSGVSHALQVNNTDDAVLLGGDADQNGVRDDVEGLIDELYTNPDIRIILRKGARALTQAMLASLTADDRDDDAASEATMHYSQCLAEYSRRDARVNHAILSSLVIDTQERWDAYARYDRGRHGTIQDVAPVDYSECISP